MKKLLLVFALLLTACGAKEEQPKKHETKHETKHIEKKVEKKKEVVTKPFTDLKREDKWNVDINGKKLTEYDWDRELIRGKKPNFPIIKLSNDFNMNGEYLSNNKKVDFKAQIKDKTVYIFKGDKLVYESDFTVKQGTKRGLILELANKEMKGVKIKGVDYIVTLPLKTAKFKTGLLLAFDIEVEKDNLFGLEKSEYGNSINFVYVIN